ncbi:uncharacterized protein N7511_005631 [Penicillium nucicola]|uniref:uncharacterized protein n=1 Tax=Penicillium nucicola TaxID=1850975 RepID=UPI0025456105|nr:uncharacterized protein N7511_005631 [Penicillium nucicola]KAJ5762249.1 hypothetical protein N7511_005631 [Penicillium nucicola]
MQLPPFAWTLMWGGTWSNIFGEYVPDELHAWGWVMWDAARLENTRSEEYLVNALVDFGDPKEMHEALVG